MSSLPAASRRPHAVQPGTQFQAGQLVWDRIAGTEQFKHLIAKKRAFILPAFLFFLVYCLALPLLAGYAPHLMSKKLIWGMSFAYLFALSQFLVGWVIAGLYLRASAKFDKVVEDLMRANTSEGGK